MKGQVAVARVRHEQERPIERREVDAPDVDAEGGAALIDPHTVGGIDLVSGQAVAQLA